MSMDFKFKRKKASVALSKCPHIILLPQQRKKIDIKSVDFDDLVQSLKQQGQIHPIYVIVLDTLSKAKDYRFEFLKFYGGKEEDFPLKADGKKYYILVTGHRRWNAIQLAQLHFVDIHYLVPPDAVDGKKIAIRAALFQAAENLHSRPPAVDEAISIITIHNALTSLGKVTQDQIAKYAGRSVDTVRNALKFGGLPEFIRKEVVNDNLVYGKSVILSSLCDEHAVKIGISQSVVETVLKVVMIEQLPEQKIKDIVNGILKYQKDRFNGESFNLDNGINIKEVIKASENRLKPAIVMRFMQAKLWLIESLRRLREEKIIIKTLGGAVLEDESIRNQILGTADVLEEFSNLSYAYRIILKSDRNKALASVKRVRESITSS